MWRAVSRRRLALVAALFVPALAPSCASAPHSLEWRVELATAELLARTDSVVARVLEGDCSGATIYDARIRPRDTMTMSPPLLSAGHYGLAAFAIDRDCAIVASDCREVVLPSSGEITLLLTDGATAPRCPTDVCTAHGCVGTDAGPRDAAPTDGGARDAGDAGHDGAASDASDAGPYDAGPHDSGPRDTGPPDTGVDAAVCTSTAPGVSGSFVSSPWISRVDAAGTAIHFAASGGATGTLTLSGGATATGSVVATELCTSTCTPLSFRGVTGSGHTLTFRDWMDVESTITLAGATATGGLELSGSDGYLVTFSTSGATVTFSNGGTPRVVGDLVFVPETTCE
jgi:hypothetical protein